MTVTKAQVTRIMKAVERRGYNINEDLARVVASVIGEIPDILDYMIAMAREDERKDLNYADYKRAAKLNTKLSGPLTKKEKEIKIREEIEDEKPIKPAPVKRVYAKKVEVKKEPEEEPKSEKEVEKEMSKHVHTPVKKMEEKKEMKEEKKEIKVEKKEEKKMEKKEEEEKKTYSLKERNEILNKLKEKGISVPARGRGMKTSELDEKLNKL